MSEDKVITIQQRGPILHIDDNEESRNNLKAALAERGLEVISLDSGDHAIRFIQAKSWSWYPWVIITDIILSGIGGYQLIQRINEYYPKRTIPIIIYSSLSSTLDITDAEVAGASAFLSKESPTDDLIVTMQMLTKKEKDENRPTGILVSVPQVKCNLYGSA